MAKFQTERTLYEFPLGLAVLHDGQETISVAATARSQSGVSFFTPVEASSKYSSETSVT